jgi:hypothetical protein
MTVEPGNDSWQKQDFFSSQLPERFCGSPTTLSNEYRRLLPWRERGQGVKLATNFLLVPKLRMHGAIPPLPIYLHGVMLNYTI